MHNIICYLICILLIICFLLFSYLYIVSFFFHFHSSSILFSKNHPPTSKKSIWKQNHSNYLFPTNYKFIRIHFYPTSVTYHSLHYFITHHFRPYLNLFLPFSLNLFSITILLCNSPPFTLFRSLSTTHIIPPTMNFFRCSFLLPPHRVH